MAAVLEGAYVSKKKDPSEPRLKPGNKKGVPLPKGVDPTKGGPKRINAQTFKPTDEQREDVLRGVMMGLTADQLAVLVNVTVPTLYKHFRPELAKGRAEANFKVAANLYDIATSPTAKGNVPAAMFWLKTRAGWKETTVIEMTGADGAPLNPVQNETLDTRSLTFEQREMLREALEAAMAIGAEKAQAALPKGLGALSAPDEG